MSKPTVAIVGRPNVGKSTLFNLLAGRRISIVDDTPGVTRDRIYAETDWRGRKISVIDTGGIEPFTEDSIMKQMKVQAEIAIETADVIIFMVDLKQGLTSDDMEVANILRKSLKPIVIAVNKTDVQMPLPADVYEFYNLGLGDPVPVSSSNALGIGELLDEVYNHLPVLETEVENDDSIKVAVIGKPNSGKSSLINKLIGEERLIVSEIPGTTRDAIDTAVVKDGTRYVFIDTAGIRKKSKIIADIERYSILRSFRAVDRATVSVLLIDARDGVTEQDTKIAGYAHEEGKAILIVVNKWDLIEKQTGTLESYSKDVYDKLGFMQYAPVVFISALTGQRVDRVFELVKYVNEQSSLRISTGMLNDVMNEALAIVQPPSDKGKRLKLYYITQTSVRPPSFVLFVNDKELMHYSYERFIENQLRKTFGFEGTPLRFEYREKNSES